MLEGIEQRTMLYNWVRYGFVLYGMAFHAAGSRLDRLVNITIWFGLVLYSLICLSLVWFGTIEYGMVLYSMAFQGAGSSGQCGAV